ncbi:hypothetical protein BDV12DRAFT_181061 [Aspergillus spectabilis]
MHCHCQLLLEPRHLLEVPGDLAAADIPCIINARAMAGSRTIRSTSQSCPVTGHIVCWSCRKL